MSQTVILVRHGEKPGADLPGLGVDEEGNEDEGVRSWFAGGSGREAWFFFSLRSAIRTPRRDLCFGRI